MSNIMLLTINYFNYSIFIKNCGASSDGHPAKS